jgi:hypothetical protein
MAQISNLRSQNDTETETYIVEKNEVESESLKRRRADKCQQSS